MITVTAVGYITRKPELLAFQSGAQKVEFDVVSRRSEKQNGQWADVYEHATFFAWGEEAERIASNLDKGMNVVCVGQQESSHWKDRETGQNRQKVCYRLLSWQVQRQQSREGGQRDTPAPAPRAEHARSASQGGYPQQGRPPAAQPQRSAPAAPPPARDGFGDFEIGGAPAAGGTFADDEMIPY